MDLETYLVNAFAEELAQGNPAGVVFHEEPIAAEDMRRIALDLGKSETAFVGAGGDERPIRWFSPLKEMPLCGHATLAAAKLLFDREA